MTNNSPDVIDGTSAELVPADGRMLLGVQDPVEQLAAAERFAAALKAKIEQNKLSHRINGKDYLGIEALQMAATALGIVGVVTATQKLENGYSARAEARTLDGRTVGAGESGCSRDEPSWRGKADYAVQGMAETRALARALRGPVGSVVSLAAFAVTAEEEMEPAETAQTPAPLPGWARPTSDVPAASRALTQLLQAAGVPVAAKATANIGQGLFNRCDNTIPVVAHGLIEEIRDVVLAARQQPDEAVS
jgi:hypothetical protein